MTDVGMDRISTDTAIAEMLMDVADDVLVLEHFRLVVDAAGEVVRHAARSRLRTPAGPGA